MPTTMIDHVRLYTADMCMRLVPLPPRTKFPTAKDWGTNTLNTEDEAVAFYTAHPDWNVGVALGPSRVCSLDIDHLESLRTIATALPWPLDDLLRGYPMLQGSPKGRRVMFSLPRDLDLRYHKLTWPANGDAKPITVFELRCADTQQRQDVLPPSIHPDTGKPYVWLNPPDWCDPFPYPPAWLLSVWEHFDALAPAMLEICPWYVAHKPIERTKPARTEGPSVIDAYNAAHDICETLEAYGYKRVGSRYLSPFSSTGLPGVNVFPNNKCVIHHASDPLCSGQPRSPFDFFLCFSHNGDYRAAVREAAREVGM